MCSKQLLLHQVWQNRSDRPSDCCIVPEKPPDVILEVLNSKIPKFQITSYIIASVWIYNTSILFA